jgi:undecaprenyl-diphosphatase
MIFIGNCRYEPSGLGPSRRPRLDDGHLDVRILRADVPRSRLRLAATMLSGHLPRSATYSEMTVRELRVDSPRRRLPIARDGDRDARRGTWSWTSRRGDWRSSPAIGHMSECHVMSVR